MMGTDAFVGSLLLIVIEVYSELCTDFGNLQHTLRIEVTSPESRLVQGVNPMQCARECLLWKGCKSFNYGHGVCSLYTYNNSSDVFTAKPNTSFLFSNIDVWPQSLAGRCGHHSCPSNTRCDPTTEGQICIVLVFNVTVKTKAVVGTAHVDTLATRSTVHANANQGCAPPLVPAHSRILAPIEPWIITDIGTTVNYTCDPGHLPVGVASCLSTGNWSEFSCRAFPTSCSEVKLCNDTDGEYWIYLTEFNYRKAQIYCHDMGSEDPKAFLSLVFSNTGYYPGVKNYKCKGEGPLQNIYKQKQAGTTAYSKIQLDLTTLAVDIESKTFANGSAITLGRYAVSEDCYNEHNNSSYTEPTCGPEGNFTINLRGTGFKIDPKQEWTAFGWMPILKYESEDEAVMNLNCGGFCGGCKPIGDFHLKPNLNEDLPENSATTILCAAAIKNVGV